MRGLRLEAPHSKSCTEPRPAAGHRRTQTHGQSCASARAMLPVATAGPHRERCSPGRARLPAPLWARLAANARTADPGSLLRRENADPSLGAVCAPGGEGVVALREETGTRPALAAEAAGAPAVAACGRPGLGWHGRQCRALGKGRYVRWRAEAGSHRALPVLTLTPAEEKAQRAGRPAKAPGATGGRGRRRKASPPPRLRLSHESAAAASLPSEGAGNSRSPPLPPVFSDPDTPLTAGRCGSQEVKGHRGKLRSGNPKRTGARPLAAVPSPSSSPLKDSTATRQKTTGPFP